MNITKFQADCLNLVLQHEPEAIRQQVAGLRLVDLEHTGCGCIYSYGPDTPLLPEDKVEYILCETTLKTDALPYGAELSVTILNGRIDALEILARSADYHKTEPETYWF